MEQATRPTMTSRPLFSAHLMTEEERLTKMRAFVRMVIDNYEAVGNPIPLDDPLHRFADGGDLE